MTIAALIRDIAEQIWDGELTTHYNEWSNLGKLLSLFKGDHDKETHRVTFADGSWLQPDEENPDNAIMAIG